MTLAVKGVGACLLAALVAGCNPQAPKTAPTPTRLPATPFKRPALHITGHGSALRPVRSTLQIHNRVEYELDSRSFESQGAQGSARAVFHDARVVFYDPNGKTLTATAPRALVDESTHSITLLDGVHARSSSGMTLQCDSLVYDHAAGTLAGKGNVAIVDPRGFRGTGSSFHSDISLSSVRMQ